MRSASCSRHPAAVRAIGGQRVEAVDDGEDARAQGNLFALEAVGIAGAVPVLVVMPDDRGDGIGKLDRRQDLRADGRVALHGLELAGGQPAGLVENVLRDGYLARVVQERRGLEAAQRILVGDAELARQRQRAVLHPPHVPRRDVVTRVDGGRQRVHGRDEHVQLRDVQRGIGSSRQRGPVSWLLCLDTEHCVSHIAIDKPSVPNLKHYCKYAVFK